MGIGGRVLAYMRNSEEVVYECRQCGTVVDEADQECSACESNDIVIYELE